LTQPITFLSDYGYDDEFAGVCRAVIARIAPDANVIDLTHGIERHGVAQGAALLANALPFTPVGVHLAVVDPGVGSDRRALAVRARAEDRLLVGPDNGLLWPAIERLSGIAEVADVSLSRFRLEPISATFHGRDVFAPVAAQLARGAGLAEAGEELDPGEVERLEVSQPAIDDEGNVLAHVVHLDRFGNVALDLTAEELPSTSLRLGHKVVVEIGGEPRDAVFSLTFADVQPGDLIVYRNSYGAIALAVNRESAGAALDLGPGDEVALRSA
jgi:S-adenosyl-L-methionine hydrolase (adenosine-forming)